MCGSASDDIYIDNVWVDPEGARAGYASLVRSADNRSCRWYYVWDASLASPGEHLITVTATNLLGSHAEANVRVQVPEGARWPSLPGGSTQTGPPDTTTLVCTVAVISWAICVVALIVSGLYIRHRKRR